MTIVAFPARDVARRLGIPDDATIDGVKLSLDGTIVELRVADRQPPSSFRVAGGVAHATTSAQPITVSAAVVA